MKKGGYVYILTNRMNKVLYIGVTSCLERRIYEHRNNLFRSFTAKYKLHKLVYYECYERIEDAITREKNLKGKTRTKKIALINSINPAWRELDPSAPPQDDGATPQDDGATPQDDGATPQDDGTQVGLPRSSNILIL